MEVLSPGAIIDAVVERIEPYGAWIDHEGRRGLVGIPEVSWSRIGHPGEALSVGQRIRVKVLAVAEGQFSASIRAAHPELDPWRDPAEFSKGTAFVAPVVLETAYGCFVELRPEVWGLLPREKCPDGVRVGDRLRVTVESTDVMHRKVEVSLSPHSDA
jgi:small subunit ribosomal protein S1